MKITDGEKLWMWRRQRKLSQAEACAQLGVGRTRLSAMEQGKHVVTVGVSLRELSAGDLLALARRRSGASLRKAAEEYGVSHVQFLKMEAAGDPGLRRFWKKAGFIG